MKRNGFTITELLVAVGLLAAVLAACGVIFNYSLDSYRTAGATAEIMRNLRAITEQLNSDFASFMGEPAFFGTAGEPNSAAADSVAFLAGGDFQTSREYGSKTIRGNVARIYYGQAQNPSPTSTNLQDRMNKILARRQIILAPAETSSQNINEYEPNNLIGILKQYHYGDSVAMKASWLQRPDIDPSSRPDDIAMYLAKGVDNFLIEYADGLSGGAIIWKRPTGNFYSPVLKFTFTLYDSKGIIKGGRRFEHTVYIKK